MENENSVGSSRIPVRFHGGDRRGRGESGVNDQIRTEAHGGTDARFAQRVNGDALAMPVGLANGGAQLGIADLVLRRAFNGLG